MASNRLKEYVSSRFFVSRFRFFVMDRKYNHESAKERKREMKIANSDIVDLTRVA